VPQQPKLRSIERPVPIREQVQKILKERILSGQILPSTRLVEVAVAGELGVSRTPVREALHVLEREGFLEAAPGGGYRVSAVSWNEVEELCEIRVVNETLAATWALRRMTPEVLRLLEQNLAQAEAEIRGGRPEAFVERDAEFHDLLARASGSERLLELCRLLRRHMLRYRRKALHLAESGLTAIAGHRKIMECLAKADEESLRRAMQEHIEQSKEDIRRRAFEEEEAEGRRERKAEHA
jgi:GntR family transcriptional regulator, rspAB operon transcriptional repressor